MSMMTINTLQHAATRCNTHLGLGRQSLHVIDDQQLLRPAALNARPNGRAVERRTMLRHTPIRHLRT